MLYLIILLAIFAPGLYIPGLANIWYSDILMLLVFIWWIFSPPQVAIEYKSYMRSKLMLPLYLFIIWLLLVTIFTLSASPEVPPALTLFAFVGRLRPIFFLLLALPYCSDRKKLYKIFNFLIFIFVLQAIVVFCQKFDIAGINSWYTPKFRILGIAEDQYLAGRRTIGSIGNPNSVGTFMSVCAVLGFSVYIFGLGLRRWIGLLTAALSLIACVFFAGTRQGTLSILLGCTVISIIAFFLGKIGRLVLVAITVFFSSPIFLYYLIQSDVLFRRFAVLRGAEGVTEVGSVQARLLLWPEFFGTYGGWIFTGKGMAGFAAAITWDSGWLMLIVAGGIPLALMYLWWMMRVSSACFKALSYRSIEPALVGFLMAGPATTFIVIITNFVNNTYNDTKISILIGLVYILSLSAAYQLGYSEYAPMDLYEEEEDLAIRDDNYD